ncbi:MAG TPA: O-antigen ligase family protein [Bryobacteraceae bacterium]|jgi:O-antigen ligase|nr:O-antigen ligase family protein [Bryobacteraceae bacterium]
MGFYFALVYVFLRFSMAQESLTLLVRVNLYLALLCGLPAVVLALVGGGAQRASRSTTGKLWIAFVAMMAASMPFSVWLGGSASLFLGYVRTEIPIFFLIGGMVLTWKEFKMLMNALAISGVCALAMEKLFSSTEDVRLSLGGGSISNSNDYAAHLLMLLPFLLWVIFIPVARIYKIAAAGLLVTGLFFILKTGSRGALIAIAVGFLLIFVKGSGKLRWTLGLLGPVVIVASFSFLPATVLFRFADLFGNNQQISAAADVTGVEGSSEQRRYLLRKSIEFTFEHPIFGVGPGDFAVFEGGSRAETKHGEWQQTHNSYTQVSSEVGLPAAFFFIGAAMTGLFSFNRVMKRAWRDKTPILVSTAFVCMLSMVLMMTCMAFLSLAYRFYLPALTGLAIALERIQRMEFSDPAPAAAPVAARAGIAVRRPPQRRVPRENSSAWS